VCLCALFFVASPTENEEACADICAGTSYGTLEINNHSPYCATVHIFGPQKDTINLQDVNNKFCEEELTILVGRYVYVAELFDAKQPQPNDKGIKNGSFVILPQEHTYLVIK
jgi:hypothetical protein